MALNLDEIRSPPNPNSPEQPSIRMGQHIPSSPPQQLQDVYANQTMNQTTSNLVPNPQNLQNQPQSQSNVGQIDSRLEYQLKRYSTIISIITILIILWDVLFIECFCLLRFSCIPDGVETPLYVLKAMGTIFFFALMFGPGTHYIVQKADKDGVRFFKFVNIAFIIALIVLFVVSFFLMGGFDQDDIIDKWAQLNPLEKLKYSDNIQDLIDENKTNLLLHAIYNIGLTILFVFLTIYLFAFDSVLPLVWLRVNKPRTAISEDNLIIVQKKKRATGAQRIKKGLLGTGRKSPHMLPIINEERASLMGSNSRIPEGQRSPTQQFQREDFPRARAFNESPDRPARQMENYGDSSFGQSPDRYPRNPEFAGSPDRYPRGPDYASPEQGVGPRNVYTSGYNQPGPNRFQNIELVTSNYNQGSPGNYQNQGQGQGQGQSEPGFRKRQF